MGKAVEAKNTDEDLMQSEADLEDELDQAMQSLNLVQMKMRITKAPQAKEEVKEQEEDGQLYCVELIGQDTDKFRFAKAANDLIDTSLAFAIDEIDMHVA